MSDNETAFDDDDVQIHTTKTIKKPTRLTVAKTQKSNDESKPERVPGGRVEKPVEKKFEKKFKKNLDSSELRSSGSSGATGSKAAKFSSLFKNNHEIPKVGE